MAPVLFLFLMSAFAETLEVAWKEAGIDVCTVRSGTGIRLTAGKGIYEDTHPRNILHATSPPWKSSSAYTLYVDDGSFIFSSRDNLIQGIDLIHHHFARLGLEMHIG